MIVETWHRRSLVASFVRRQYQLRYRQSIAGLGWAVVPPIASLVVATVVFQKTLGVDTGETPYQLFVLAGLAPWTFFAACVSSGVPSIAVQMSMVTRLAFPRVAIPLSVVGTALIDLGITTSLLIGYVLVTRVGLPLTALWAPLLLVIEIVFAVGVVLLGSALNVFARDIRLAVPLVVQLWLYLTPVMYPIDDVTGPIRTFYRLNPMTGLIESFRRVLVDGYAPDVTVLAPSMIGAVVMLALGIWYFSATESRFADVI